MIQTAIVFGATGLVGKELVFELLEDKNLVKVTAVVRKNLPISHPKLEQLVISDYSQLEQHKDNLNADAFFCCIGTTIKIAGSHEAFRKVDFEIPVIIARIAATLSVANMVVISSVGADAVSSNFYLHTKGEMEAAVKEIYKGNLKIVRPSLLMGNRSEFRFGERVAVIIMKALGFIMIGPLRNYKGIYAWDVARAMIKATGLPSGKIIIESAELHDMVEQNGVKHNPHEIIK